PELRGVSQQPASWGDRVDGAGGDPAHRRAYANPPGSQYFARCVRAHHRFPPRGSLRALPWRGDAQLDGAQEPTRAHRHHPPHGRAPRLGRAARSGARPRASVREAGRWGREMISRHPLLLVAAFLLAAACGQQGGPVRETLRAGEWHAFEGAWTAAGTRRTLRLGMDDRAAIFELTGSLLLTGAERPAVGFRAQAIGFSDSRTGMQGRCVWTDERQACKDAASGPTSAATWFTAS